MANRGLLLRVCRSVKLFVAMLSLLNMSVALISEVRGPDWIMPDLPSDIETRCPALIRGGRERTALIPPQWRAG